MEAPMMALVQRSEEETLVSPVSPDKAEAGKKILQGVLIVKKDDGEEANLMEMVKAGEFAGIKSIDIDDKAGAERVYELSRILAKARTSLGKVRSTLTDPAEQYKKALIAAEKEIISVIEPEEKRLRAIYDNWEKALKDRAVEEERKEQARIAKRTERVLKTGAILDPESGNYSLGAVVINSVQVKVLSDEAFDEALSMMEKEAERRAEAERKEKEKQERLKLRISKAYNAGAQYNGIVYFHSDSDVDATTEDLLEMEDDRFQTMLEKWKSDHAKAEAVREQKKRADEEEKRIAEEAAAKAAAERKEKEEILAAMRSRITKLAIAELVETGGWKHEGDQMVLANGGTQSVSSLPDLSEEQFAALVQQGRDAVDAIRMAALKVQEERERFLANLGATMHDGYVEAGRLRVEKYTIRDMSTADFDRLCCDVEDKLRPPAESNPVQEEKPQPIELRTHVMGDGIKMTIIPSPMFDAMAGAQAGMVPPGAAQAIEEATKIATALDSDTRISDIEHDARELEAMGAELHSVIFGATERMKTESGRARLRAQICYISNIIEGINKDAQQLRAQP